MEAKLTSKGQLTLPKPIRDRLGLKSGSRVDFRVQSDGVVVVEAIETDPLAISRILPPRRKNVTEAQLQDAIGCHAVDRFRRASRSK